MENEEEGPSVSAVKTYRSNCGGCISLAHGVVICSVIILVAGVLGTICLAMYLARNADVLPWDEISVSSTSLYFCSCVIGLTIFGLYAVWKQKSGLVELYFWTFLIHWILELSSTIVLLAVVHQKWQGIAQSSCSTTTPVQACMMPCQIRVILLTCGLCIYKIIGAYTAYLIFRYRKQLIAQENKNTPILRWLRRASSSSLFSIVERKWWSPSQVPVIKIDFASDQSSASSYSNDSAGCRTVAFGQPYPPSIAPLQIPQQVMFSSHIGDGLTASHELPTLPSYSVVAHREVL